MGKFRIVLTAYQAFMGPYKLSSLVTILSNHTSLLQGGFSVGQCSPGRAELWLGSKTSSWMQEPNFDLVETSWKVVVREFLETAHKTCCKTFPLRGVHHFESS
jgi:hypothetical protein